MGTIVPLPSTPVEAVPTSPERDLLAESTSISQPPSAFEVAANRAFRGLALAFAWGAVLVVVWVVGEVGHVAQPAIRAYGLGFMSGTVWDANRQSFGILPQIFGTLYTAVIGLTFGTIFGVAIAIFLSEGFLATFVDRALRALGFAEHPWLVTLPTRVEAVLKITLELLAAIPSVVYGLWGIFVVIPLVRPGADWFNAHLGWIPLFGTNLSGPGILPASLVLAIMVLPTISALSRDALVAVPVRLREAAMGLGATQWEAILGVILPAAATGIFGSIVLGFGRALGETIALAMLAGNANVISWSLFSPCSTLAALLANHFPEAGTIEVGALMYAALVLLSITLLVNIIGAVILQRAEAGLRGLR
ncbi:MAG TPA: phosphate ABC transporter permease subunit PstC [Candidatus Margulisiibacteriota bacterium]|nr:phosphate ABC transporter permease subunit PstC [Candidatus Margulisiibacteriota bacterium]